MLLPPESARRRQTFLRLQFALLLLTLGLPAVVWNLGVPLREIRMRQTAIDLGQQTLKLLAQEPELQTLEELNTLMVRMAGGDLIPEGVLAQLERTKEELSRATSEPDSNAGRQAAVSAMSTARARLADHLTQLRHEQQSRWGALEGRASLAFVALLMVPAGLAGSLFWYLQPQRQRRGRKKLVSPDLSLENSAVPLSFTRMALAQLRTGSGSFQGLGYTEKVLQSLSNLLILTDPEGSIKMVNDAVCQALEYQRSELIGQPFSKVLGHDAEEAVPGSRNVEVSYRDKEGELVPVLVSCSAVFNDDGSVNGLVIIAQDITDRKEAEEALKDSEQRLRQLMDRLVTAQEEERRKAARDLHDGMLQLVIAADLQLTAFRKKWSGDGAAEEMLRSSAARLSESVKEGRRLINNLRPPTLDKFGLAHSVKQDLESLGRELNVPVDFSGRLEEELPASIETTLYRIAQEAMNNIRKHAEPDRIELQLWSEGGLVRMVVQDHGKGFEPDPSSSGVGLHSMRERAELQGGWLQLTSAPGEGTRVEVAVPMQVG